VLANQWYWVHGIASHVGYCYALQEHLLQIGDARLLLGTQYVLVDTRRACCESSSRAWYAVDTRYKGYSIMYRIPDVDLRALTLGCPIYAHHDVIPLVSCVSCVPKGTKGVQVLKGPGLATPATRPFKHFRP